MSVTCNIETVGLFLEATRRDLQERIAAYELGIERFGRGSEDLHELGVSRAQLEKVERALQRLGRGKYGVCERCGQPIDPARLQVLPATTLCLRCSSRLGEGR